MSPPYRLVPRAHAVVLVAAAALAAWGVTAAGRQPRRPWPTFGARADDTFGGLRALSSPGERIGVFVPPGQPAFEQAFWYSAQYALAPAIVQPVYVRECLGGPGGCGAEGVERFALPRTIEPVASVLERRLGLRTIGASGGVLVLGRAAP